MHWVRSHVDLDGNENADRLANIITNLSEALHAEQTAWAYSHLIKGHFAQQLRRIATENTSPLQNWYEKNTVPGLNFLPNREADTQLRRLRFFGFYQERSQYPTQHNLPSLYQQYFTPNPLLNWLPSSPHLPKTSKGPTNPAAKQLDWPRLCRPPHQKVHHHPRLYSPSTKEGSIHLSLTPVIMYFYFFTSRGCAQ